MDWGSLLLALAAVYATVKLSLIARGEQNIKFLGLALASGLFMMSVFSLFVQSATSTSISAFLVISEWGHILSLAFILSALAVFIRESKPVFAQFPLVYTALPVLIVISYYVVIDTYALKTWLISIYQGGAIVVGLLMYSVYTYRRGIYRWVLLGTVLMLLSYLLYWFIPGISSEYAWIWQIVLAAGVFTVIYGYEQVLKVKQGERRATLE